ncbi:MAG: hypothetical protein LCH85_08045 [Chloroflexi bacterium]|nr:hypothetical protein [Chloroflexota bacterium]
MKQWMSRMLLGVLAIALSGCVASQVETTISGDGSGTNTFKVGMDAETMAMMSSMGGTEGEDPFKKTKDDVSGYPAEWSATTSDWKEKLGETEFQGVQVNMKFANLATLNEQLNQFLTDSGSSDSPTGQALSNLKVTDDGETFTVSGNAVATDLAAAAESESSGMPGMGDSLKKAVIVWQVTLPGEVSSVEPAEIATVNGSTVTWKIPVDKTATYTLKAVSTKSGGGAGGSNLPLILGGVGLLVVLAGVGFFVMSRRKAAPVAAGYQQYGGQTYDPNAQQNQQQGYYDPNNDPNRKQ